jgi:membrane protein YdbS with pleckstrin-like domain
LKRSSRSKRHWVIFLTPVLAVLLLLPFVPDILKIIAVPAYLLILAAKYAYEVVYYRRYLYDMTGQTLAIKKGVFGSKEIIIPYGKIQDIFVSQDILDRFFGLRDVYVSTVSGRSILNAHIDGVSVKNAEILALLINEGVKGGK